MIVDSVIVTINKQADSAIVAIRDNYKSRQCQMTIDKRMAEEQETDSAY
jgi:hypothetical protein